VTSTDEPVADEDPEVNRSPYEAPPEPERKSSPVTDPSVFAEPWMEAVLHPAEISDPGPAMPLTDHVCEDQSVWDELGLSRELAGDVPEDGLTWYRWYLDQVAATSATWSWAVTLGVAVVGGLFAIVGTLAQQSMPGGQFLAVTVVGPTVEEIMKIALPLWLVEKRPWLYRNAGQILICAMASGLMFAAVAVSEGLHQQSSYRFDSVAMDGLRVTAFRLLHCGWNWSVEDLVSFSQGTTCARVGRWSSLDRRGDCVARLVQRYRHSIGIGRAGFLTLAACESLLSRDGSSRSTIPTRCLTYHTGRSCSGGMNSQERSMCARPHRCLQQGNKKPRRWLGVNGEKSSTVLPHGPTMAAAAGFEAHRRC